MGSAISTRRRRARTEPSDQTRTSLRPTALSTTAIIGRSRLSDALLPSSEPSRMLRTANDPKLRS